MNKDQIQAFLVGLNDVTAFARQYKLPLRTLVRMKAGEGTPRAATLALVGKAIKRYQKKHGKVQA